MLDALLVQLNDISFHVQNRSILDSVSLSVRAGEIVTLIGPNGAGKTTLVKIVLGLLSPSSGSLVRNSKLRLGYMPQKFHLDPNLPLSVTRFLKLTQKADAAIEASLREVGILHLAKSAITSISGGELQRVLLARALLRKPQLLVLDEPVQGVDVAGQSELYQLISHVKDHYHCGVLMVSHDLHLVMSATDTVVCLNQHVCCQGHPDTVSSDPAYLSLFGKKGVDSMATYTHHHDHQHDLSGHVVDQQKERAGR